MSEVLWNFDEQEFQNIQDFEKRLIQYNKEIKGSTEHLNLFQIILESPKVVIQYFYWGINEDGDEEMFEPDFLLEADNNKSFTALELLFKVHNNVCKKLKDEDEKFFQGFDHYEVENPNNLAISLYFLNQGS